MFSETVAPRTDDAPWWQRCQAQVDVEVRLTPGMLSVRKWLLDAEGHFERTYKGYRCFWPRGHVRVLGFYVGAALFVRGAAVVPPGSSGE